MLAIPEFVHDFANALQRADARNPVAVNARTRAHFQAGIGPHSENDAVRLIAQELKALRPDLYSTIRLASPYPNNPRQKCDLRLGSEPDAPAIEVKMLRLLGDNGKLNDNMLMHILSPYHQHRSALTDCEKLVLSGFQGARAILIYAFDSDLFPSELAVRAFEVLASDRVRLSERASAHFSELVHPIHVRGSVFACEVFPRASTASLIAFDING